MRGSDFWFDLQRRVKITASQLQVTRSTPRDMCDGPIHVFNGVRGIVGQRLVEPVERTVDIALGTPFQVGDGKVECMLSLSRDLPVHAGLLYSYSSAGSSTTLICPLRNQTSVGRSAGR